MTSLDCALDYIGRGWSPIPVPFRSKRPVLEAWHELRIGAADAPHYFNGAAQNVGVLLGPASNGLSDVDLDCPEACAVAPYLLPRTAATFGRASRPSSHWLYRTDLAKTCEEATFAYRDPTDNAMLVELRVGGGGRGAQTVFPGSVHETGEAIRWDDTGDPAEVVGKDLHGAVNRVAAAALLARNWPGPHARHEPALAVGGMLAHGGWDVAHAKLFMEAVTIAARDPDPRDRIKAVETSFERMRAGKPVTGLPTLTEHLGERVAKRAAEWLGLVVDAFGFTRRAGEDHACVGAQRPFMGRSGYVDLGGSARDAPAVSGGCRARLVRMAHQSRKGRWCYARPYSSPAPVNCVEHDRHGSARSSLALMVRAADAMDGHRGLLGHREDARHRRNHPGSSDDREEPPDADCRNAPTA